MSSDYTLTLKDMCSRKWATPLLAAVSYLDPVSIHSPTVAVGAPESSVATLMPLSRTDTWVGGATSPEDWGAAEAPRTMDYN